MSSTPRLVTQLTVVAVLTATVGCRTPRHGIRLGADGPAGEEFVTQKGNRLWCQGKEYRALGVNTIAATRMTRPSSCGKSTTS